MEKKICHFILQYNQERMCPAPNCPFGGNIAMLQSFNCANRVGGSQRQCRTWNCVIINFSGLSIFHSDWQNLYFLAYYWQFSFQKLVFWSLNVFFSNYWWLLKRTAQTVTLLEKSGIMWSHTGLETFQRRNCKGLWKRNNGCVLHNQNSHYLNKKIVLLTSFTPLFFVFFWCLSWRSLLYVSSGDFTCVWNPVWENCRIHHYKLFYNHNYVMM